MIAAALPSMAMETLSVSKGPLALMGSYCATDATEYANGYTWTYRINGGSTAEIYGTSSWDMGTYTYIPAISPAPTGAVTIPSSLGGTPVMTIGSYAFCNCTGLTSVTIPAGVSYIYQEAFRGCSGLESFVVEEGNLSYKSDSRLLLSKDGHTLVAVAPSGLTSLTIPDGVTSIGPYAFSGCTGLTSLAIPDSVTSIGSSAFSGCSDALFDTTTVPGVRLLDGWAVGYTVWPSGSLDLTGVRNIADEAFSGCESLQSAALPDMLQKIENGLFAGCRRLASVSLPETVTLIGDETFRDCVSLRSINLPLDLKWLGSGAFRGCASLERLELPDTQIRIGRNAFAGCPRLTLVVPKGSAAEAYAREQRIRCRRTGAAR